MLGLHGLHNGFRGVPGVEVVAHVDSNTKKIKERIAYGAKRHYLPYTEIRPERLNLLFRIDQLIA
jgi:hypothetical protein